MLAYELYLNNQNYTGEFFDHHPPRLLKKIYVNKEWNITIDTKSLSEYGEQNFQDQSYNNKFLQNWLSMPLESSNKEWLNLPFKITGSNSLPPYLRIKGKYEKKGNKENITLELSGKDDHKKNISLKSKLILSNSKISNLKQEFPENGIDIIVRIDKDNYKIKEKDKDKNLFDAYIESKIIIKDMVFKSDLFTKISESFFSYVTEKQKPDVYIPESIDRDNFFEIVVLPSDSSIKYDPKTSGKDRSLKKKK